MQPPIVSVIMPTYNRADTIVRAVQSVRAQNFTNWELLVVDDGSSDETLELLRSIPDERVRVFESEHQGCGGARNIGLLNSTGKYIAFLDSDDEWLPHHLELSVSFLDAHPDADIVSAEIWENLGKGCTIIHYRAELASWYQTGRKKIGSKMLALPEGETDDYCRIYSRKLAVGDWANKALAGTSFGEVSHYQGNIYQQLRWGWLICLQPTLITRRALEVGGLFDTRYSISPDFGFLARICKAFDVHFLSAPAAIKHELTEAGSRLREQHLAGGKNEIQFAKDMLNLFDELFWSSNPNDHELLALRSFKQYYLARTLIEKGSISEGLGYLNAALTNNFFYWKIYFLKWLVVLVRQEKALRQILITVRRFEDLKQRAKVLLRPFAFQRQAASWIV